MIVKIVSHEAACLCFPVAADITGVDTSEIACHSRSDPVEM